MADDLVEVARQQALIRIAHDHEAHEVAFGHIRVVPAWEHGHAATSHISVDVRLGVVAGKSACELANGQL